MIFHTSVANFTKLLLFIVLLIVCLFYFSSSVLSDNSKLFEQKNFHVPKLLAQNDVLKIAGELNDVDEIKLILDKILVARVVGTKQHFEVKEYIKNYMNNLNWLVESDKFIEKAPIFGDLEFENIIATNQPNATRFLVLACHYDSKFVKNEEFLGATDSAVPCAIMMSLAKKLDSRLKTSAIRDTVGLRFIFFDGEEAFLNWSETDSIYGARHLASKWEKEDVLKTIDILVLLDLLGAKQPTIYSYIESGDKWFNHLHGIESRLNAVNVLQHEVNNELVSTTQKSYFEPYSFRAGIEDDHVPFMRRNVTILHIIPYPFPDCWHKSDDNLSVVDFDTVSNLEKIIGLFVLEYLHCEIIQ